MTVERLSFSRKNVIVGIRFDDHTKELLDWALVKVAELGDNVVAIHVCRNSDCVSKAKAQLDGYLKDYNGLCNKKQVYVIAEVHKGNSIKKILVREAKNRNASAVIVGITKHNALRGWTSISKYCSKRLPPTTEVMAIQNGKIVFSRNSKSSFYVSDNRSEFGESEISSKDENTPIGGNHKRGSLSCISLPAEDFTKQRPGWPLLQTASSVTQPALEARKMSVVQWAMKLPNRPLSESKKDLPNDLELLIVKNSTGCQVFDYGLLKSSTSDFSSGNFIAKGGSNSVYKGILPEGKHVAVKISESSKESWKDFTREIEIMTTLKHIGIAPLLGICIEDNHLMSVYDFLSNGNLEDRLQGNSKENSLLSWEARFKIAVGIAKALNYIHNDCPRPVIHRDVKSSNILLTDEFEPQLSDFGLAIWGPTTSSFSTDSDVVGTFGYIAPEYFMFGKVSEKIDVYAFGVVLLELLSGRKPIGLDMKDQESLVMWAKPKLESGDFKSILDPNLCGNIDEDQMQRMAIAARYCLTQAARLRPKMCQILNILNGEACLDGIMKISQCGKLDDDSENYGENDDEVYPDSSAESHLSLAFLDVNEYSSTSFSSLDQVSPMSVEEYLKQRWSRSSSLD